MIIGNGLVATAFRQYDPGPGTVIIAAGVSDSTMNSEVAFAREASLLRDILDRHFGKHIVYISTCSTYDMSLQASPYVQHKLAMENMIMKSGVTFHIFRMSNLVGNSAKATTFFHLLTEHIRSGTTFDLWVHARRNIIGCDDAVSICSYILQKVMYRNDITNVAHPDNFSVPLLAEWIGQYFGIIPVFRAVEKGAEPRIDTSKILPVYNALGIGFDDRYVQNLLKKYYPK